MTLNYHAIHTWLPKINSSLTCHDIHREFNGFNHSAKLRAHGASFIANKL